MPRPTIAILASLLACIAGILPVGAAGSAPAFPAPDRLHVLFISPPHGYNGDTAAECTLLESLSNVRFTNVMTPTNGGDQIADVDAHFGADDRWIPLRKAELLRQLQRPWEAVCLAAAVGDGEITQLLTDYVANGGTLISLDGISPAGMQITAPAVPVVNPLAGLGLEPAGMQLAGKAKLLTTNMATLCPLPAGKATTPLATYGTSGKGRVLSLPSLFPVRCAAGVDGDWLWAQAFERLVRFAVRGVVEPVIVVTAAPAAATAAPAVSQKYAVTLTGPRGVTVRVLQSDMRGGGQELAKAIMLTGEPVTTEVTLRIANAPLLMLQALPVAGAATAGMTFVKLPAPLGLDLYTTQQGHLPDFATHSTLQLDPKLDLGKATLHWTVQDWARRTVAYRAEPLELVAGTKVEKSFDYTLADPDARAYIYWLQVSVLDAAGHLLARGTTKLYRYRPYVSNEQLLVGTWHTDTVSGRSGIAEQFAAYLRGCGFNAVFSFADQDVFERHNFRQYMEHQGTTRVGIGNAAPFRADIDGYAARYQAEGRSRAGVGKGFGEPGYRGPWPSAALNLFSMGEETGFGPWSESYPWRNQEAAPDECNKWFRHYLQQFYGNDLGKLNTAWDRTFTDWSEIKVWRKYAQPYGWMFMPPPQDLEPNLTPYVDTHAFHEWYVRQYCENYMKGYATGNPVTTWTMSYDFTFLQFSPMPMTNFWHALAPEGVALWHTYIRARTPGHGNPFHLNWMFFEDEPMNNQFLQLGLASGCTYLFNWGPMFNGDLTPSRKTLAVAKTMAQAKRPEAILRTMTPHTDPRVGIYTLDSRWALVRGRYGFFLQPNGPHDVAMGKGPYQAPGASYVKPPELPLYTALTASGYAPKFVTPAEFGDCKVLFMPYVEAIDPETAAKVEQYVRDGGTLVVFPTIAQYDAGGKPYPQYPGAGFDKLLGFTADPTWLMGRAQVEFPGENAAKKAFAEAWLLGQQTENAPATQGKPPVFFNMTMRIGGHPCYYMPEGRQRLTNLQKDVVVIGRHEDGNPLFTYRQVGKGAAICFNVLLTGESGLAQTVTEATETFREAIDQLVRRCGVSPDIEFFNTRSYGEGISDFVTMQYDVPGATTRLLTLFTDWRGRRADARLRLRAPFTAVYDVLTGDKLVTIMNEAAVGRDMSFATGSRGEKNAAPETVVVVEPGHWRVLALTTEPRPAPTLTGPATATLGETVAFQIGPDAKATRYGRVEVTGPDGNLLAHHGAGVVLPPGEPLRLRLRLDDPLTTPAGQAAPWMVRYRDALTGQAAETKLAVRAGADAAALAKAALPGDGESLSRQGARRGPAISDAEFLGLLTLLRAQHLATQPVDKRTYSYYSYELGDSRHRAMQVLACVDWPTRVTALAEFLATGERLYLVGEDLGYDAAAGVTTTPGRNPRILEALQQLAGRKEAAVLAVSGKPYLRVVQVGKGLLVLDRRSPDAAGNSNLHLAAFQQAWRQEIVRAGLAPGGNGTRFLPVGGEPLKEWFFAQ
jgi:hypothetical protein